MRDIEALKKLADDIEAKEDFNIGFYGQCVCAVVLGAQESIDLAGYGAPLEPELSAANALGITRDEFCDAAYGVKWHDNPNLKKQVADRFRKLAE